MNHGFLIHYMNESFQYKLDEHRYLIKLITTKNDYDSVRLGFLEKYFREKDLFGMPDETFYIECKKVASTDDVDYYEAEFSDIIPLRGVKEKVETFLKNHPNLGRFQEMAEQVKKCEGTDIEMLSCAYFFELNRGQEKFYYGNYKFFEKEPHDVLDMFNLVIHQANCSFFKTPDWSKGAVIYQIFPERFAPTDGKFSEDWNQIPMKAATRTNGTLKGIEQKIPYLKELGIDAIYLTPIFLANSSHRYDSVDYMRIDPLLGSPEEFASLVEKLHKNGIKIILDLVFNHSSMNFFAFQDVLKNQESSIYRDWYFFSKFPVEITFPATYMGFSFGPGMPKLNTNNPECRSYLLNVTRHYLEKYAVDGYRLDVANEVSHDFWKDFRRLCKSINPEAIIMGEIWYDSTTYLRGDEFDSVMNYTYFDAIRGLLNGRFTADQFASIIERERGETSLCCYHNSNLLVGSHDTDRILHAVGGDKAKIRQAMTMLFTLPGSPILYYGDEKMMDGALDPDCRRGMIFDEAYNQEEFNFVKKLIRLKHLLPLQKGDIHFESTSPYISYVRTHGEESVIILLNPCNSAIFEPKYQDYINLIDDSIFEGNLPANGIAILTRKKRNP